MQVSDAAMDRERFLSAGYFDATAVGALAPVQKPILGSQDIAKIWSLVSGVAWCLAVGLLLAVFTSVVFPVISNAELKVFSSAQRSAIAEKRQYLRLNSQGQFTPPPEADEQPAAPIPIYSYRSPAPATSDDEYEDRADAVTIVFTGAASVFDVKFDMTNSLYGNYNAPVDYFPSDVVTHQQWYDNCGSSPQFVEPAPESGWTGSTGNVFSRDFTPYGCLDNPEWFDFQGDNRTFHVRLYEVSVELTVATPHFDSEIHGWGSFRLNEARDLVTATFTEGADLSGAPLWFVNDIWKFNPAGNNTEPRGCLRKDANGNPVHNPGVASHPDFALPCFDLPDGWVYFIDLIA